MPTLGPVELIIILFIVLVLFGAGRLADIGGSLGKGIREFRKATHEDDPAGTGAKAEEAKKDQA